MKISRKSMIWGLALLALIVLTVLLAGPGGASPDNPKGLNGLLGLKRLLALEGATVRSGVGAPSPGDDTFVLTLDLRTRGEDARLLQWVKEGGALVVADPASFLVQMLGVSVEDDVGSIAIADLRPGCAVPAVVGVLQVSVAPGDQLLTGDPHQIPCFLKGQGSYALQMLLGRGTVTVLGGYSPFVNRWLAHSDNARFALQLLGRRTVAFGTPTAPGQPESAGVGGSLPLAAKIVIGQLILGALLFAVSRARRLGRPIREDPISPIPGGELVRATGRLLRKSSARADATTWIRDFTRRRLASKRIEDRALNDASSEPGDDAELISIAAAIEHERRRLEEQE